jgi:hypothetical protein
MKKYHVLSKTNIRFIIVFNKNKIIFIYYDMKIIINKNRHYLINLNFYS